MLIMCKYLSSCFDIVLAVYIAFKFAFVTIGGFKGEAGEALPPQIFLTLKFVVCVALKIIEIVAT